MDNFFEAVGKGLVVSLIIFVMAILSGTLFWLIYDSLHALFPTAAEKGIIAKELGWWDAVCVTWIFSILIKATLTNNK